MKILPSIGLIVALGLTFLVACSEQESAETQPAVTGKYEYVAAMTGIT